ncbi:MAG: hydroxymethylbilane synthase [Candidatus Omnitrophica bacterium]|nr:hydroxymethylbilane synthase [Candidatus Omnitrophota bacterium]
MTSLTIGTRGSKLALAQAHLVRGALEKAQPGLRCELVVIKTTGDDFTAGGSEARGTVPLKGLFVKEIEEALLLGKIDLAVHSVKDLQAGLPRGLAIAAVLKREDPRDALVAGDGMTLKNLPQGAAVGASSLRRQAQLKRARRDLNAAAIRGNVDTRLRKLDSGEYGALILAACGLIRLGLAHRVSEYLDPSFMLPCPGQGALGVEIHEERKEIGELIKVLDDPDSHWEVKAERAFLEALGGGCSVPVGGLARVRDGNLSMTGIVLSPDGLKAIRKEIAGSKQEAERLGKELASHLRAAGADRLLFGLWAQKGAA